MPPSTSDSRASSSRFTLQRLLGGIAIAAAVVWMALAIGAGDFPGARSLWIRVPCFGCDFTRVIDYPTRVWWGGGDAYASEEYYFPYPPFVLRLFAWVNATTPETALTLWQLVIPICVAIAAWQACRWRERLKLEPVAPALGAGLLLLSTPALFAFERAQCDPVIVLFLAAALPFLRSSTRPSGELAGGALLALAALTKVYPGLLLVGLVALRKWYALGAFAACGLVFSLWSFEQMQAFLVANAAHIKAAKYVALEVGLTGELMTSSHPMSLWWGSLWATTPFAWMGAIPNNVATAGLLGPLLAWVLAHVFFSKAREAVTYPLLLWIVALATFVPVVSNDYNLIPLPLAVLATWSRRDTLPLQIALVLLLLWWQPVALPGIGGRLLFVVKFVGLWATGVCIVRRLREAAHSAAPVLPRASARRR